MKAEQTIQSSMGAHAAKAGRGERDPGSRGEFPPRSLSPFLPCRLSGLPAFDPASRTRVSKLK
jgi:hypothetical protein